MTATLQAGQQAALKNFVENVLNEPPKKEWIKVNKLAKNSLYLPIQVIEDELNRVFYGLWETKNFSYKNFANEMTASIDLVVVHPVTGQTITRTGTAAVIIQQRKLKVIDDQGNVSYETPEVTDISTKIHNTLGKDMGHLKSECIKNAAKSFGRRFGNDLNRDAVEKAFLLTYEDVNKLLQKVNTREELEAAFASLGQWGIHDPATRELFSVRAHELKQEKLQINQDNEREQNTRSERTNKKVDQQPRQQSNDLFGG